MQHTLWYIPVAIVLVMGYLIGGVSPVAIYYFHWLEAIIPKSFIPILLSFLIGLLGSNVQLSIHLAKEMNVFFVEQKDKRTLPSCFEFFGYLLKQVWGGLAAVFFVLSVKLGFLAAVATVGEMQLSAIVIISFCSGLRAYQILKILAGIIPAKPAGTSA